MRTGIMAQVLAQRGHQITWWTSTFDHFNHRHRYETDVCLEVSSNYKIQYIRGYGYQRNVSISRILDNNLVGKRFAQLIRKQTETPDIIIASIPTAELALEAVRYGRQHNIPVILDIRDLWPDVFYDLVPSYTHPVIDLITIPMTRKLEQACAGATSIVGLTEAFLNWGIKHANRLKNKNDQVFPMGYLTNSCYPSQQESADKFWQDKGVTKSEYLLVTFVGTIGKTNDLFPVIEAAKLLNDTQAKVKFVICGAGENLSILQSKAEKLNNIIFPGWINSEQIISLLEMADIGIAPYINSKNYISNVPNKPAEYLSRGLGIALSLDCGVLYDILQEHNIGFSYYSDAEKLANNLDCLSKDTQRLKTMQTNASSIFDKFFNGEAVYNQMADYLENIVVNS
ncbi:hypothetical protein CWATWH0402_782 [Crocosphaera watsonii WH 0402]|uniref:Glycosyl transferase family 1 domain-containing protein n=4 Tax=Crocosphaera watsonii TaxID=263511 RepID=T2JGG9_CROWT|nr:glycosyltransferase family 4 protein [Crocosphaera watsonii]CCQ53686.1 glycosyl transferase, group 1 [Crocosphaera watsonii WH 0005]CCQ64918.1 hypothetical protein CWATWH0402_782 [Crocosphaera watsonii WH 0402]